jgi:hypothetical protein
MAIANVERKAYARVQPCLLNGMSERRSVEVKHVSPLLLSECVHSVATPHPLAARICPTKINQISAKLGARNLFPSSLAAINSFQFDGLIEPNNTDVFEVASSLPKRALTCSSMAQVRLHP